MDSQSLVALLVPWNGKRLNVTRIAAALAVSRTTARAYLGRLESEGLIRLLPFFGAGHRPLLYLVGRYDNRVESLRAFCTDAVIAGLREIDPGSQFYYWSTGRVRRIDLLAVIARKRVGFCFSDGPIRQHRHWWPLRLALRRRVIDLGCLLNTGRWSSSIDEQLFERPISGFLTTLSRWIAARAGAPGRPAAEPLCQLLDQRAGPSGA